MTKLMKVHALVIAPLAQRPGWWGSDNEESISYGRRLIGLEPLVAGSMESSILGTACNMMFPLEK
jgi:hypothetical protein